MYPPISWWHKFRHPISDSEVSLNSYFKAHERNLSGIFFLENQWSDVNFTRFVPIISIVISLLLIHCTDSWLMLMSDDQIASLKKDRQKHMNYNISTWSIVLPFSPLFGHLVILYHLSILSINFLLLLPDIKMSGPEKKNLEVLITPNTFPLWHLKDYILFVVKTDDRLIRPCHFVVPIVGGVMKIFIKVACSALYC